MLEKGLGVKKDLVVAHKLYVAAAGKGHAKAMHNLAVLYAEGAEGKPDYVNAAQWFRKAAERGVADSQFNLGVLTVRGLGTEKNIAESYKWFALAAAQGDRDAGRKRDEVAGYLNAEDPCGCPGSRQKLRSQASAGGGDHGSAAVGRLGSRDVPTPGKAASGRPAFDQCLQLRKAVNRRDL